MPIKSRKWPQEAIDIIRQNYELSRADIQNLLLEYGYNIAGSTIQSYKREEYIRINGPEYVNIKQKRYKKPKIHSDYTFRIEVAPPKPSKPSIPINELKDRVYLKFETGMHGEPESIVKKYARYAFIEAAWRLGYTYSQIAYVLETKRYAVMESHRIMATNRILVREVGFILQDFGLIPIRKAS